MHGPGTSVVVVVGIVVEVVVIVVVDDVVVVVGAEHPDCTHASSEGAPPGPWRQRGWMEHVRAAPLV